MFNVYRVIAWREDWADDERTYLGRSSVSDRVHVVALEEVDAFLESIDPESETLETLAVGVSAFVIHEKTDDKEEDDSALYPHDEEDGIASDHLDLCAFESSNAGPFVPATPKPEPRHSYRPPERVEK